MQENKDMPNTRLNTGIITSIRLKRLFIPVCCLMMLSAGMFIFRNSRSQITPGAPLNVRVLKSQSPANSSEQGNQSSIDDLSRELKTLSQSKNLSTRQKEHQKYLEEKISLLKEIDDHQIRISLREDDPQTDINQLKRQVKELETKVDNLDQVQNTN